MAFTFAALAPVLVLLLGVCLARAKLTLQLAIVGANLRNFPTSGLDFLSAVLFQVVLGAILTLYAFYWLQLNMIQTLQYLAVLFVVFLVVSNRTLNYLAARNKTIKVA